MCFTPSTFADMIVLVWKDSKLPPGFPPFRFPGEPHARSDCTHSFPRRGASSLSTQLSQNRLARRRRPDVAGALESGGIGRRAIVPEIGDLDLSRRRAAAP